jgi:hypothetical protein
MTELELEAMKQQYDAHTLESDFYQDSYMHVISGRMLDKMKDTGTLHDTDKDEEVH